MCLLDKEVQVVSLSPRTAPRAFLLHSHQGTASSPDSTFPALGLARPPPFLLSFPANFLKNSFEQVPSQLFKKQFRAGSSTLLGASRVLGTARPRSRAQVGHENPEKVGDVTAGDAPQAFRAPWVAETGRLALPCAQRPRGPPPCAPPRPPRFTGVCVIISTVLIDFFCFLFHSKGRVV